MVIAIVVTISQWHEGEVLQALPDISHKVALGLECW